MWWPLQYLKPLLMIVYLLGCSLDALGALLEALEERHGKLFWMDVMENFFDGRHGGRHEKIFDGRHGKLFFGRHGKIFWKNFDKILMDVMENFFHDVHQKFSHALLTCKSKKMSMASIKTFSKK